jgi:predicted AlkP superfamily pyrophosphatase or phosphodiesterase
MTVYRTWFFVCLLALGGGIFAGDETRPADHVILISIDGFRPDFYRDHGWPAPTLQHFASQGVSADGVRGVFPSVTYPSHTTLITGAKPARHGVFYNEPFNTDGQDGTWYWFEKDITTTTLWDAAKAADLVTASMFWPVSAGAPISYNVPEIWPLESEGDYFAWLRQHEQPQGLLDELERKIAGTFIKDIYSFRNDIYAALATAYLIENHRPNLTTLHLLLTDFAQHAEGRDSLWVRQAVAQVDLCVAMIWEAVKRAGLTDRSAIIVTGDHGFVNIHNTLAPNLWLIKAGLRSADKDRGDWKATFHSTGAAAFLHLRNPGDQTTLTQVRRILAELPPSRSKLFRIVDKHELKRIGGPTDAALALTPVEGVEISSAILPADLVPSRKRGNHGYLPDFANIYTGFIGYGAGFQKQRKLDLMGLEDIAPLIAALLDLEFEAPDGTLYSGLLQR